MINTRFMGYIKTLDSLPYGVVYEKNQGLPQGVVFKNGKLNLLPRGFLTRRDIPMERFLPFVKKYQIRNYTGQEIITCSRGIFFVEKLPV